MRIKERTTGELMVLMVATTVCGSIVVGLIGIVILAVMNPGFDFGSAARTIADLLTTLVGLLAGFLAGKTDVIIRNKEPSKTGEPPKDQP